MPISADPFTLASPQYRAAVATCQRSGVAFTVGPAPRPFLRLARLAMQMLAVVGFFTVAFVALACLAVR